MRFLYLVCRDENIRAQPGEIGAAVDSWIPDVESRGILLQGQPLAPPSTAATVRVRDGSAVVDAGPFTESVERIIGFDIVECSDMDEALSEARRHPMAPFGCIEVRAFDE